MPLRRVRAATALVFVVAASCAAWSTTHDPAANGERVPGTSHPARAGAPAPAPVVLIVLENHGYGQIVGNASAQYLNRFARRGTLFTRMRALGHPSLPNYLALTSGSTLGCTSDACPPRSFRADNVFHQLETAGKRWRAYQESMPGRCVLHDAGRYVVRHNPAAYYRNLFPDDCPRRDRSYPSRLPLRLPPLTFVTPDACHDMHDCSVGVGDAWLREHAPPFLARGAIVVITFDEGSGTDHIFCAARGPGIGRGVRRSAAFTHLSLLAAIERHLGLPLLRGARSARVLPL
jgi:phosphatidylinositol-3-phosphatase